MSGEPGRVDDLLRTAGADPAVRAFAEVIRLEWMLETRPAEAAASIDATLPGLLEQLTTAEDERGLAKGHMLASYRQFMASRNAPAATELSLAADHAHNAGDEGLRSRAFSMYVACLIYGPTPASEMATELDRVERDGQGRRVQAAVEVGRSKLALLSGDFDAAREWAQRAVTTFGAIGGEAGWAWECVSDAERGAGDLAAALANLERVDAIDVESGRDAFRSTNQAKIAELHLLLGDNVAARAAIELSETLSAKEDVLNYAITHRVRAELALDAGDYGEAERWAQSAVEHAQLSDEIGVQAAAELALARVVAAAGQTDEARVQAQAALALREAKGDRPGVAEARAFLDGL